MSAAGPAAYDGQAPPASFEFVFLTAEVRRELGIADEQTMLLHISNLRPVNRRNASRYFSRLRAATAGGPYTELTNTVTDLFYSDTNVVIGTPYYYIVTATNACGESEYSSMEAPASPGLPAPWQDSLAVFSIPF